ncbi:hypothetical protein PFICI_12804 [Pestalotiopsis fici W106-1]|uniref:Thiamine pyrophosphokinase n=1 Tax=Pestalotiopsis fici (strain W106-1 / CGMCC3.15140) TaxID=1229662 RepID=W3WPN2_PESFW|nr:uncharacterized protein PFICI_12804 [Pestalotiopsis fici W106-1]ETS75860.1 hypothetical protein PFICI_12804 [Pestalotiopsis fici W106-1]
MNTPTVWRPARMLQEESPDRDFALIILNQPLNDVQTLGRLWQNSSLRIAADGGANRLCDLQQREGQETKGGDAPNFNDLDVIIGDLDSLSDSVRAHFEKVNPSIKIITVKDQYSTDFSKAVSHARASAEAGDKDIVAMGGLGGRVDQGLSQIHHLYLFQTSPTYAKGKMYLVSGESLTFLLKAGSHQIHVREPRCNGNAGAAPEEIFAKYAGIIPVKEPSVITLKGFEWDVTDWPTEFGGQMSTSNHVLPESQVVEVTTSKDVLFTIALNGRDGRG